MTSLAEHCPASALERAVTKALTAACVFPLLTVLFLQSVFAIPTADGLSHTFTTAYDAASRPTSVTDPLSIAVSQTVFDSAGRVTQRKNGLNNTTQFFYDMAGRLSYTLDPMNRRVDHTYDFAGRNLTLKNRLDRTFTTGYGSDGLPDTFSYPSGRQSSVTARDLVGRPSTLQEPSGQQTTLTYEGMGRVRTKADGVGTITWTFDGEGNPTNVAQGATNIGRTFDNLGRVLTCTDTAGNTVSYAYDNEGNTASITYPGNKTVTYTYDGSNRLKTVTDWASRLTTYTYDNAGRLTQVDRPNGTRQRLQYDNAKRLTDTFEEKGAVSFWQAGYGYNNAYRLTSYTPSPITKTLAPPPATMTYDLDNRLATYNGQSVGSDSDGNLLSVPLNGTLLDSVTWDARNRLNSAGGTTYVHDAENRRVSSTISGQTTGYTWSRGAKLDRLLVKTNPDGSMTRYIHGLGLLYEETTPAGGGSATTSFYHYNWQGSTVALSDASGNVTARMSYSPYGERTVESGTVTTSFCFNGQFGVMTESNGLLCMQARFYSPIFRRFLSEDPAGFSGGINLYAYTGGDPVNFMDPFGLGPKGILDSLFDGFASAFTSVMQAGESLYMAAGGWEYDYQQRLRNEATAEYWGQFSDGERIVYGLVPGAYQSYEAMLAFSMGDYSGGTEHLVYAGIELGMAWFTGKAMAPAAPKGTSPSLVYHYTTAPESSFANGLWEGSSVTRTLYTNPAVASQHLGIPVPTTVIPILDVGQFIPNKPPIVQRSYRFTGGGTDLTNPLPVPPSQILPARPVGAR